MTGAGNQRDSLLTQLLVQAEGRVSDTVSLRAMVEEASSAGATVALARLGLDDPRARQDMDELRSLLSAWRDAKRSAWRAVVGWIARIALATLLVGLAVRLGLTDLIHAPTH